MKMKPLVGGQVYVLSDTIRVTEINIRKDVSKKSFGALEFVF